MDREEVIRIAKEAGWSGLYITWAKPTGEPDWTPFKETLTVPVTAEQVERFASLVAAAERERAAQLAEGATAYTQFQTVEHYKISSVIAHAIRALKD